jgi:hypothetical protein
MRLGKWQGPYQRGVGKREHGAVRSNPQRECEDGNECEPWRGLQLPYREAHVVAELFKPARESHFSLPLSAKVYARALQSRGISNSRQHHLARDAWVYSPVDQLAGAHLHVKGDLFIDFLVDIDTP